MFLFKLLIKLNPFSHKFTTFIKLPNQIYINYQHQNKTNKLSILIYIFQYIFNIVK
jgi:hypothetical protein